MNKTRHSSPSQSSASFRLASAAGLPLCTRRLPPIPMWNIHAPSKWHSDGRSGSCMDCCLQALSQNGRRVPERGRARGSFRFLCRWSFEGDGETAYFETKISHSSWQNWSMYVSIMLWGTLALSYFSKMVLEKPQSFVGADGGHGVVAEGRYQGRILFCCWGNWQSPRCFVEFGISRES